MYLLSYLTYIYFLPVNKKIQTINLLCNRTNNENSLNKEDRDCEDENRIRKLEEQLRKLSSTADQWEERYQQVRRSLDDC